MALKRKISDSSPILILIFTFIQSHSTNIIYNKMRQTKLTEFTSGGRTRVTRGNSDLPKEEPKPEESEEEESEQESSGPPK